MKIHRQTYACVHLNHLSQNIKFLKKEISKSSFLCPMIKANAYGHGDEEIALGLQKEGITSMGVGLIEEGLFLRKRKVNAQLLVFGIFDKEGAKEVLKNKLTPVISTWEQLEILEKLIKEKPLLLNSYHQEKNKIHKSKALPIHLKFDTGMHRLGFQVKEAEKLFDKIIQTKSLKIEGLATHLHSGEDACHFQGQSMNQLLKFKEVEKKFSSLNPILHTLNSAGTLSFFKMKQELRTAAKSSLQLSNGISLNQGIRPGLLVYGLSPLNKEDSDIKLPIKFVMSLRSHVVKYIHLEKGESVSYGATWKASKKSIIGVVPIGYADGYHRNLSNIGEVLFAGQKVSVVGNVCMDYIMIDVSQVLQNQNIDFFRNQEVTLFGYDSKGNSIAASDLAQKAKTITWEILTSVGIRVPRVFEE